MRTVLALTAIGLASLIPAQTRPAFEVASVKPADPGTGVGSWTQSSLGEFSFIGSLHSLIKKAYDVEDFRISGEPKWLDADMFRIDAKPGGAQANLMLQTLLADRFKLAVRHETKELPVYALVVGKYGPKLEKDETGTSGMASGRGMLRGTMDIAALASSLSTTLGRQVVDKTDLKGPYRFSLKWTPDDEPAPATGNAPSLVTAIQEQLGLKLESTKGLVDVLVIDHAEKPSAN
jgi:uncharacterized protein (TIGR03435 family)